DERDGLWLSADAAAAARSVVRRSDAAQPDGPGGLQCQSLRDDGRPPPDGSARLSQHGGPGRLLPDAGTDAQLLSAAASARGPGGAPPGRSSLGTERETADAHLEGRPVSVAS